jgi:hypothetical protein
MFELTEEALQILMDKFVENIKKQIATKQFEYAPGYNGKGTKRDVNNKIASGGLYDSIQGDVEIGTDGNPYAVLYYADYFKYVNEGRRPGFHINREGIQKLLQWIKIRGVKFRTEKGRFKRGSNLQMAFAIERNIYKYGIKPANIYDKGLDGVEDLFDDFPNNLPPEMRAVGEQLFEAVAKDINLFIEKTLEAELK